MLLAAAVASRGPDTSCAATMRTKAAEPQMSERRCAEGRAEEVAVRATGTARRTPSRRPLKLQEFREAGKNLGVT
jgi:hypothetical protein